MRVVEAGERVESAVHLAQRLAKAGRQPALQLRGEHAGAAVKQLAQELVLGGLLLLDGGDLPLLEVGQLGSGLDGVIEVAELIHQTELLGILASPDAAFSRFLRLFRAQAAALAHQTDEALVGILDVKLDRLTDVFRQSAGQTDADIIGGADAVGVHAVLGERLVDGGEHAEYPDGAGEGGRGGEDLVRIGRDPVATGGGVAAHGDHHRLASLFQGQQLGADLLGGEGAAARAVDPQYHGFDLVIAASIGQQVGEGIAADGAGRLDAIHDGAAGDHQTHLILAALGILIRDGGQILFQANPFPAVVVRFAHFLDDRLGHLVAGRQLIHQPVVEGVVGGVATGLAQQLEEAILARCHGVRFDFALLGYIGHIGLPQLIQPALVRLLALGGHLVAGIGLDEGFVGADLEHVRGDVELLQRRLEVGLVDAEPLDHHGAALVEQHVIGVGGQQVLALAVEVGHGDNRFAALLELVDGGSHLLQLGEAGALQPLRLYHQRLDAIVILGAANGPQQVGEEDLARLLVAVVHLAQQLRGGIGRAALFHQYAVEVEGQSAFDGRLRSLFLANAVDDDQHQCEKQQIDQHQPGEVEQAPQRAEQPTQTFEDRHSRVIALLMGKEGSLLTS